MTSSEKKPAGKRLSTLEFTGKLGNVSKVRRKRRGIAGPQFSEYKRRPQTYGLEGLVYISPIPNFHANTTPQKVVDTYGSYAFGSNHTGKLPERSAYLLNDVLPQYDERGLEVKAVLTENGREYCGRDHHIFRLVKSSIAERR